MAAPDYVLDLRRTFGQGLLLLPGVSAVVLRGGPVHERVLLVRRSDNGRWSLPAGILEPGEQPADAIAREVLEETCVRVRPERLALLSTDPPLSYPNGDRCQFVSMTFRCAYLGGEARVGDDESTEVAWFALADLPGLGRRDQRRLACGRSDSPVTEFDVG